ncbi:class 1 fructose-bisphosphatase [Aquariibacter albus]|uniref:Fructose-1,6-bisphosphatase class 1 n=1 Tax=Aquariibacter albus TaxID=2759899 RepID=A0A839HKU0_9BURK|nr:class 1 fructose-bisphosphatase [Aquariibacter albus]MBB1162436.1 fructose-1,6-bisphosphatase [Aquariibacter albus]
MHLGRTTLSKFLIEELRGGSEAPDLGALLVDVAAAVKAIAAMAGKGALGLPPPGAETAGGGLEHLARQTLLQACEWGGLVAGMATPALEAPYALPPQYRRGPFLLLFEAIEDSGDRVGNAAVGTLFSVLRHAGEAVPQAEAFLQPGVRQLAAGYAIYGPATMLVLTVGRGTHGFTLDREVGNFILTHPDLRIPAEGGECAIDASHERFWEPPLRRYVRECKAGRAGERGRAFSLRWIDSTVAAVHRVLTVGGVFMVPRMRADPDAPVDEAVPQDTLPLHQLCGVNPVAWLVEQAGGRASTGRGRVLEVEPKALHARVPLILGSCDEIERIERYHAEHDSGADEAYVSPLFNQRSLYRAEARRGPSRGFGRQP